MRYQILDCQSLSCQRLFVAVFILLLSAPAHSRLDEIKVSSRDVKTNTGRSVYDLKTPLKGAASAKALATMKRARLTSDFKGCAEGAGHARAAAPELASWIAIQELECANLLYISSAKDSSRLPAAIKNAVTLEKKLAQGSAASRVRSRLVEAELNLLEGDVKTNRARAQETIDRLQSQTDWMDDKGRARLWRFAGELSFLQQRLEEAREYYSRSLQIADSDEIRGRLASLESSTFGKVKLPDLSGKAQATPAAPTPVTDLEASSQEIELVTRMTENLKTGDLVPVVEDGMKLIVNYPGSARAKWATDRIQDVYLQLGDRGEEQYIPLREKMIKEMLRADSDRMAEWARVAYNKGLYADAFRLGMKALDGMADSARSTKTYGLVAEAATHVEKYNDAKDLYETLVKRHSGTAFSREALLRLGLIEYRLRDYQAAQAHFERLLVLPQIDNFEVTARYWLWRSLQKNKDEARSKQEAQTLVEKFPFSYYGLRARIETNGGVLEWPKEAPAKVQASMWVTKEERAAYNRAKSLVEGGWFDEAQLELQQLPAPQKPEEKALRAQLLASAFSYPAAVRMINDAWDKSPEFRKQPFIDVAFPREFTAQINQQAKARKLESTLVASLIKQESSYNIRAQSTSPAFGLMQMIAPTAREIAQDLKIKDLMIPEDLFKPDQNILMGTYYLSKVMNKWSGNVPLALASYNAGPHRVERWMKSRPSLKDLPQARTSDPDLELWFDELPWDETSFYVKAILRNLLLYRVFDKGRLETKNPLWSE